MATRSPGNNDTSALAEYVISTMHWKKTVQQAIKKINSLEIKESYIKNQLEECVKALETAQFSANKLTQAAEDFFTFANLDQNRTDEIKIEQMNKYLQHIEEVHNEFKETAQLSCNTSDSVWKAKIAAERIITAQAVGSIVMAFEPSIFIIHGFLSSRIGRIAGRAVEQHIIPYFYEEKYKNLERVIKEITDLNSNISSVGSNIGEIRQQLALLKKAIQEPDEAAKVSMAFLKGIRKDYDMIKRHKQEESGLITDTNYPQVLFFKKSIKIEVTSYGDSLDQFEEIGISLSVPEGAISSSDEPLKLHIRPCLSGPFQLPPEYEPASPVYLIQYSKEANFRKDLTAKIHHYVNLKSREDCEDMAFFSASSTPQYTKGTNPVYNFKKTGANTRFSEEDHILIGEISLRPFCFIQVGKKRSIEKKHKGHQRLYSAKLYKHEQCRGDVSAIFCICLYHPLHIKARKEKISEEHGMEAGSQSEVVATITGDKVEVKAIWTAGEIEFDRTPAIILKQAIDYPEIMEYEVKDIDPPKLTIYTKNAKPGSESMEKPRIEILGLNVPCIFNNLPSPSSRPSRPSIFPAPQPHREEPAPPPSILPAPQPHKEEPSPPPSILPAPQPHREEGNTATHPPEAYNMSPYASPQIPTGNQDLREELLSHSQHSFTKHSKMARVDDSELDVDDDLEDVLEAVKPLASEWKKLLMRLHITQDTLDVIDRNNPGDAELCLQVGLSKWLKMNYNYQRHGRPSWSMLAKAMSNINNKLSEKIAKNHPTN